MCIRDRDNLNVSGVSTFTGAIDANGDLDVDGHTELDTLNVAGVSTFASAIIAADGDLRFTTSSTWSGNHTKIQHYANILYFGIGGNGAVFREGAVNRIWIDGNGHFRPNLDSDGSTGYDLGRSDFYWRNLYVNGISTKGKVGIGTDNPTEDLHIKGTTPVIRLEDSDTSRQSQIVGIDGNLRFDADNNNAQADTNISFRTDGSEKLRISSDGKVGINSTAPTSKLDVDGDVKVSGITTSTGVINSQTDIRINNVSVIETALNDAVAMAIALG